MSKKRPEDIRIDHVHSRAICDEIGDRLRTMLTRELNELPLYLKVLVDRLAGLEVEVAPSIVPSFDEAFTQLHYDDHRVFADID